MIRRTDVTRRFPPPWSVEELEACFVLRDHSGPALADVLILRMSHLRPCLTKPAGANAPLTIPRRHSISNLRTAASGQ